MIRPFETLVVDAELEAIQDAFNVVRESSSERYTDASSYMPLLYRVSHHDNETPFTHLYIYGQVRETHGMVFMALNLNQSGEPLGKVANVINTLMRLADNSYGDKVRVPGKMICTTHGTPCMLIRCCHHLVSSMDAPETYKKTKHSLREFYVLTPILPSESMLPTRSLYESLRAELTTALSRGRQSDNTYKTAILRTF